MFGPGNLRYVLVHRKKGSSIHRGLQPFVASNHGHPELGTSSREIVCRNVCIWHCYGFGFRNPFDTRTVYNFQRSIQWEFFISSCLLISDWWVLHWSLLGSTLSYGERIRRQNKQRSLRRWKQQWSVERKKTWRRSFRSTEMVATFNMITIEYYPYKKTSNFFFFCMFWSKTTIQFNFLVCEPTKFCCCFASSQASDHVYASSASF